VNYPPVEYDVIHLAGGLDQVTPTLSLAPGFCRRATNFECSITGGYTRIGGYERFDGRSRPSDASYLLVNCSFSASVSIGDAVTGVTSAATGKVLLVNAGSLVLTRVTGTFVSGESLSVGGVPKATATSAYSSDADGLLDSTYRSLAANEYRASIAAVPGSGAVLGVSYYNRKLYAFRNNAGGTEAQMYVASSSGWSLIAFGEEISFSNANASVGEGDVLTKGVVTATVARMVVETGTLASGVNTGRMILTGRLGGAFSLGAATSTGGGSLTLAGASTQITLLPGGKFNCVSANFGAGPQNKRLYGADGVNRAFEFDGVNLVPISTGMSSDKPNLIAVHKQHLFLSFGYSLQFSGTGLPFSWTPVQGAGELAMNADITNLVALPGDQSSGALGIYTSYEIAVLYGTGASTFSLSSFNVGSGAVAGTAQNIDQTYFLNEQGISSLATTKNFGNFTPSALTMNLRPFLTTHLPYACASGLGRERGQYRVFYSDGFGLYVTMRSGAFVGAMPVQFPNPVLCMDEGETAAGRRTSYFGSSNGMVYELDAGTSFDGVSIDANLTLVFNGRGNHRVLKRYRKASAELTGNYYASLQIGYDLGYRSDQLEQAGDLPFSSDLRSAYWDDFSWDNFVWDGKDINPTEVGMLGTAENVAFRISSSSAALQPFTINSITVNYTKRRGIR